MRWCTVEFVDEISKLTELLLYGSEVADSDSSLSSAASRIEKKEY